MFNFLLEYTKYNKYIVTKHKPIPSRKRLLELFTYDPTTGNLHHRRSFGSAKAGNKAGSLQPSGYIIVKVDKAPYLAHRIIYRICTGVDPGDFTIDHRNHCRSDNRICNLRIATFKQQNRNQSFVPNCSYCKRNRAWRVRLAYDGVERHLGFWPTQEIARAVYATAAAEAYGDFAPAPPPNPFGFRNTHWGKCSDGSTEGVTFQKNKGKWVARITIDGQRKWLGTFTTQLKAREARWTAEYELAYQKELSADLA